MMKINTPAKRWIPVGLAGILFLLFPALTWTGPSIAGDIPEYSGGNAGMGQAGVRLPVTMAKIGPVEALAAAAMVEGLALGNAWLAREYPVPYGAGMVILSPLATTGELNNWGNLALISGAAGLGLYDAINNGKEPAWRNRRFWVTYAAIHLIIIPAYAVDYLTGGNKGGGLESGVDFGPDGMMIALSVKF